VQTFPMHWHTWAAVCIHFSWCARIPGAFLYRFCRASAVCIKSAAIARWPPGLRYVLCSHGGRCAGRDHRHKLDWACGRPITIDGVIGDATAQIADKHPLAQLLPNGGAAATRCLRALSEVWVAETVAPVLQGRGGRSTGSLLANAIPQCRLRGHRSSARRLSRRRRRQHERRERRRGEQGPASECPQGRRRLHNKARVCPALPLMVVSRLEASQLDKPINIDTSHFENSVRPVVALGVCANGVIGHSLPQELLMTQDVRVCVGHGHVGDEHALAPRSAFFLVLLARGMAKLHVAQCVDGENLESLLLAVCIFS
jgi:hypothetical protein